MCIKVALLTSECKVRAVVFCCWQWERPLLSHDPTAQERASHTVNGCLWSVTVAAMQPFIVQECLSLLSESLYLHSNRIKVVCTVDVIWPGLSPAWRGLWETTLSQQLDIIFSITIILMSALSSHTHTQPAQNDPNTHSLYNKPSLSHSVCTVELNMNY